VGLTSHRGKHTAALASKSWKPQIRGRSGLPRGGRERIAEGDFAYDEEGAPKVARLQVATRPERGGGKQQRLRAPRFDVLHKVVAECGQ